MPKETIMSVTERPSYSKSFQIPAPSENLLLAVIIAAFLALHVAAGVMLTNTSSITATTTQETATPVLYD
jgi:hypothetical protein